MYLDVLLCLLYVLECATIYASMWLRKQTVENNIVYDKDKIVILTVTDEKV